MTSTTPPRPTTRALLGAMALVVFMIVYVFVASLVGLMILPNAGKVLEFVYYAVAGLAWVPFAGLIVKWMYPSRGGDRARG